MKKQWVLVGILAASLFGSPALAQHKAPNQQPATAAAPTAPTGDLALGTVQLPRAVTADGKPLPAGTYQVRLTAQEAKPDAVGTSENARALGRVRAEGHGQGTRGRQHRAAGRGEDGREGRRRRPRAARRSRCSRATTTCGSGSTRAATTT